MNDYEKIIKILDEHKEHTIAFRSETTSEIKKKILIIKKSKIKAKL